MRRRALLGAVASGVAGGCLGGPATVDPAPSVDRFETERPTCPAGPRDVATVSVGEGLVTVEGRAAHRCGVPVGVERVAADGGSVHVLVGTSREPVAVSCDPARGEPCDPATPYRLAVAPPERPSRVVVTHRNGGERTTVTTWRG